MVAEYRDRLFLGAGNVAFAPAARTAAVTVFNEEMGAADLALGWQTRNSCRAGMVVGHVQFQSLGVGARRWLPAGLLCGGIEIVRQVLRVRVANFPVLGETRSFSLCCPG